MHGAILFRAKPHQSAVLNDKTRHRCVVMHRRAGKTVTAVFALIEALLTCERPHPRVAFIRPFLKQSKKLAWDYLANTVSQAPHVFDISKGELTVSCRLNNGKAMLLGADNIDAIRGIYLDFVVVDEMADVDPNLWDSVLVYCLADRMGRALISGTPRGRMNKLYEMFQLGNSGDPEWSSHIYTVNDTDMIDAGELARLQAQVEAGHLNRALFEQEMHCSFTSSLIGAVYGDEITALTREKRFCPLDFDATLPVITAWDLGWSDATAVIHLQRRGNQMGVICYEEFTLTKLPDILAALKAKPWAANYAEHYGPHDLNVHEYGSGNSRWQIADRLGFSFDVVPNWGKEDGIEAVRALLPHLWINDQPGMGGDRLVDILSNYRMEFDSEHRSFKTKTLHDWTSHGADALRMLAVAFDPNMIEAPRRGQRSSDRMQLRWRF